MRDSEKPKIHRTTSGVMNDYMMTILEINFKDNEDAIYILQTFLR